MTETAKSLENIVLLDSVSKQAFGVEDYTEELRNAIPDENVFEGIYNQNKAVKKFFDALNSRYRAILNLGEAGVGKSSLTKGLISKLRELASNNKIIGPFSREIKTFYDRLKKHQHKDIIALWNPKDYNKPIITKLPSDGTSEDFRVAMNDAFEKIQYNITSTIEDIVAEKYVRLGVNEVLLQDPFISILGDLRFSVSSKKTKIPTLQIYVKDEENQKLTEEFNKEIRKVYETSKRADFSELYPEELHKKWNDYLLSIPKNFIQDKNRKDTNNENKKELLQQKFELSVKTGMTEFMKFKEKWSEYPDIYNWFDDVQNYITNPNILREIVYDISNNIQPAIGLIKEVLSANSNKTKGKQKQVFSTAGYYSYDLNFDKTDFHIQSLLNPEKLYNASEDSGLVIREFSIFNYADLFGGIAEKAKGPVHHNIHLGALATSDIVEVDDDFLPLLKDDTFRRSLLSFLQDGDLKILDKKVEIGIKNDCYFIVNDTQFPFMRQDFENVPPKEDAAMSRRFNIIEWAPFVENKPENRKNFPSIIQRSVDNFRTRNHVEENVFFDAQGLNTILQYILAEDGQNLLPMQIGNLEKTILEPIVNKVLEKGKSIVSERDIIDYVQEQHDDLFANLVLNSAEQEYNTNEFKPKIGTGNYLSVSKGEFGSVGLVSAAITGKKGNIASEDYIAELSDKTHLKGILNVGDWLQDHFGPLQAEVNFGYHGFGGTAGPSSSAIQTYILMSALGNIPIKQNVFVTGTILNRDGDVGPIGGVYEKVKGAYKFYEMNKGNNNEPCEILIPKKNVKELILKMKFDDELTKAYEDKKMIIKFHETIWDGFESMSGLEKSVYEPIVKKGLHKQNRKVAINEYTHKHLPFLAK